MSFYGRTVLLGLLASAALLSASADSATGGDAPDDGKVKRRCGWFDNPSPGNASLTDRDGEWTVAMQGEPGAKGKWPVFRPAQWVRTGSGSAGYGCACLKVRENTAARNITHILEARVNPLAACRQDKALTEPENPLR